MNSDFFKILQLTISSERKYIFIKLIELVIIANNKCSEKERVLVLLLLYIVSKRYLHLDLLD